MKISYNWLKELVELTESPEEIGKLLTSTGLEVEGIEEVEAVRGGLKGVVIGEVLTCEKHPEADRLSVTTVDAGFEAPLSIVCGAPNVAAGQKVLVATVGTTLYPGGGDAPLVMKKAKIRGAVSEGMICAEDELGLGNSHDGIMVLDTDLPPGTPASVYLGLSSDYVIEIGLTPNRADAASHYGVARDLKVVLKRDVRLPSVSGFEKEGRELAIDVIVEDADAAPRYTGLTMTGLTVRASPDWMKKRLQAIGIRPINNVVDVTNYICHELGQPLHAFDAEKITGGKVVVKTLPEGTPFATLDGVERKLSAHDLMICDAAGPMCIAGVFGGAVSGVTEGTTSIFLESACFSPVSIRKTSQFHGLKTDASFRFERGTDPLITDYALRRAALLIQEVAGGSISSDVSDFYPVPVTPALIPVTYAYIDKLIGKALGKDLIHEILTGLDIGIENESSEGFTAIVPPYRVDVKRGADIVEEVLRIYGFDNIEQSDSLSSAFISDFPVNDPDKLMLRVAELLAASGFNEVINNSLTRPDLQSLLGESLAGQDVKILNYLSEELSVMRRTLLFSGLGTLAYNINRRQKDLKIFEFGKSYHKIEGKYSEKSRLALFLVGNHKAENWSEKSREVQFYDLAGTVKNILTALRVPQPEMSEVNDPAFQYGMAYTVNRKVIVTLGKVNPDIAKKADVKLPVFYADFDWDYLLRRYSGTVEYAEVPKFPEVRRDLSLVLEKSVTFDQLRQLAFRTERQLLKRLNVFDVYEGGNLGGKKAYALSFILQDDQQTLTDKVIEKSMKRLMSAFETEFGAVIRNG